MTHATRERGCVINASGRRTAIKRQRFGGEYRIPADSIAYIFGAHNFYREDLIHRLPGLAGALAISLSAILSIPRQDQPDLPVAPFNCPLRARADVAIIER